MILINKDRLCYHIGLRRDCVVSRFPQALGCERDYLL